MASAASTQQSLADVFECPVCLDSFKDPRVLPACGHTFCKECIEKVHDNGIVNCPTCRKVSGEMEKITKISDLAKAFIVNEMQQILFKEEQKNSVIHFCACCSKKAEPAKYYCNFCRMCLCDSCEAQHQEGSLFEGHGTEPLDRVTFCKAHDSQPVSFHCRPCNEFICPGCAISEHNGHAVVDITIEATNHRQTLEDMMYERSQKKKENKQKMKKAKQYLQDKEQDLDDSQAEIRSIEKLTIGLIKQLQSQSEKIKSAQNTNREVTDTFLFNIRRTNSDIRHEERKLFKLLSDDMTDCQLIEKFQKLRGQLDTDYTTEGEDIPVYTHVQAISADVRHALSTLMTAVPNLPVSGNPGPNSSMAASSSKRQTDQSSTHRKKRTKTAHPETDDKHGGFGNASPMYRPSSPKTTSMTPAHTSDCVVISPDHSLRTPRYTGTIPVNNSLSPIYSPMFPVYSPMSPIYTELPLHRYRPIVQKFTLDDRPRTPDNVYNQGERPYRLNSPLYSPLSPDHPTASP